MRREQEEGEEGEWEEHRSPMDPTSIRRHSLARLGWLCPQGPLAEN